MKLYTHQQELYKLPAELGFACLLITTNLDWDGLGKHFNNQKHYQNWLNYVAARYGQDETWLRLRMTDAIDNGYFVITPAGRNEFYLERAVPQ